MGEQPEIIPPIVVEDRKERLSSGFAVFLRFIAVATVIASFIVGYHACNVDVGTYYSRYQLNGPLYAVYAITGVLGGIGWWALSYIVDACIKYLNKD